MSLRLMFTSTPSARSSRLQGLNQTIQMLINSRHGLGIVLLRHPLVAKLQVPQDYIETVSSNFAACIREDRPSEEAIAGCERQEPGDGG